MTESRYARSEPYDIEQGDVLLRRYWEDSFELFNRKTMGGFVTYSVDQIDDLIEVLHQAKKRQEAEDADGGKSATHG